MIVKKKSIRIKQPLSKIRDIKTRIIHALLYGIPPYKTHTIADLVIKLKVDAQSIRIAHILRKKIK